MRASYAEKIPLESPDEVTLKSIMPFDVKEAAILSPGNPYIILPSNSNLI